MKLEATLSTYWLINEFSEHKDSMMFTYLNISADLDMKEMQDLLQQGIMTQSDIDILLSDKSIIIANIEDIINSGHDFGLSKREIVKKLMVCLIKEHKLSSNFVRYIIKQLDNYL